MKKKWMIIIAVLALMFILMEAFTAMEKITAAKQQPSVPETTEAITEETAATAETAEPSGNKVIKPMKQSEVLLYYGEILEIETENDLPVQLSMNSPKSGELVMNLGESTCYIDSGERKSFDPATLQKGDRVYVFHSLMTTMSLPPQSPAYVVVKNIPMDAGCPMYHQILGMKEEDGNLLLTVDGDKILRFSADDTLLSYEGEALDHSALQEGQLIMGWYWDQGQDAVPASHIMLLPENDMD